MDDWQVRKNIIEANNYMLRNEIACDVTFLAGQSKEELKAHRYMMMSRSSVLHDVLSGHPASSEVVINVSDISVDTVRMILGYIYTDNIDIHSANVAHLLYAAKRFGLKGLTSLCFKFLDSELHTGNVCKIMEQAHVYLEQPLYEKCKKLVLTRATEILTTPGFAELCQECLGLILESDDMRATEELIFEATMAWAAAQCRRQKLQPTDENRRTVLGPLLYYIRFPTMDVVYFTQKVSFRDILSNDEAVSVFQYFHGEEHKLANKFSKSERNRLPLTRTVAKPETNHADTNRKPRNMTVGHSATVFPEKRRTFTPQIALKPPMSPNMSRVWRFPTFDGQWQQNGPPDAISFSCSDPIVLYGIEVYGSAKESETYHMKLCLFDDFKEEVRRNDCKMTTDFLRRTYDVMFARPIRIPARRTFTVMIAIKGSSTVKGVDGTAVHVVDGVTFEFSNSNRSSNGTDVTIGQIPGLLFNKTE